jgi:lysophospholipase L1-like esterase
MKFEVILGRIFLAIIAVTATFMLVDYASRWLLPSSRSVFERELGVPTEVFRKPKPYVMFGGSPGSPLPGNERLNRLGYRGAEPSAVKPAGEYRIFLLGGSTVLFGEPTLAVLLEEQFRKNGYSHVRVYNFGVMSSVSGMELSRILFEIADLQPDQVIMYGGGNDIYQPAHYDPRPGYPFNFMVYESNPLIESDVRNYPTATMLAYGSNLCRHFFPSLFVNRFVPLQQLRKVAGWGSKEWGESVAKTYVDNLVKADRVSRAFGARFTAFFQPLVHYKNNLSKEESVWSGDVTENYKYLREVVKTAAAGKRPLDFVDVSNVFENTSETVFKDQIHILQKHFQTVADEMFRHISRNIPR